MPSTVDTLVDNKNKKRKKKKNKSVNQTTLTKDVTLNETVSEATVPIESTPIVANELINNAATAKQGRTVKIKWVETPNGGKKKKTKTRSRQKNIRKDKRTGTEVKSETNNIASSEDVNESDFPSNWEE